MKKTKYFAWMVAAGLALTGCSDELEWYWICKSIYQLTYKFRYGNSCG